ncbi:MAG: hypothetical protein IJD35_01695 [Clostridia bacterium]|nr:hypothetical protein [Clostridia bacterium]
MKTVSFIFKKILYPACVIFTVIWFVLCLLIDSVQNVTNINLTSTVMCFVCALMISLCNLILDYKKMPFVGRFFLHMVLSVFSISVTIAIFSSFFPTAYAVSEKSFYLVLLLVVAYLVLATPTLLLYHHFVLSKKEKTPGEYTPVFKAK